MHASTISYIKVCRTSRVAIEVWLCAWEQVRVVAALAQLHDQMLHLPPAVIVALVLQTEWFSFTTLDVPFKDIVKRVQSRETSEADRVCQGHIRPCKAAWQRGQG